MIGIDLFSGAGGMSLGAKMAGIDVQVVVENDKYAAETYLSNHQPKVGFFECDIRQFTPVPLMEGDKPVVLFGGPPCQGFSTSNQRNRNSHNPNNWLFQEYLRVVEHYKPDWVVFENVRGILETEQGTFVDKIVQRLNSLGYSVSSQVLQASEYGVPQNRSRFFAVGSLHGKAFQFPKPSFSDPISVKEALSGLPKLENGASQCYREYSSAPESDYSIAMTSEEKGCHNHIVTKNNGTVIERYKHVPQGGNWENIPQDLMQNYKDRSRCHTGIYRRLKADSPSVVIGNYRKNMLIHPYENRGLSVREAARIQSFPDWFKFRGSIGFQQQQVGNAVPPLLAKAIFSEIVNQS